MNRKLLIVAAAAVCALTFSTTVRAACVNKYVARAEGNKKVFTLLTGRLTFAEAQELAKKISSRDAPPVEWLDEGGNVIAKASAFEAVRPMPVACDDKPSGSVINVTFLTFATPGEGVTVKFSNELLVYFEAQGK